MSDSQINRNQVRPAMLDKAIVLLMFATLPNFVVVSTRLAFTKGTELIDLAFTERNSGKLDIGI